MKIALLARNPHLYSHRRICEAARARGHEIEVVNTLRVSINITSRRPALYYRKRRLEDFDAVIPRIGASVTFYGLAVLRQFEVMGVYPLNESVAIGRSRDKLRCLQLLARRGIGLPVTAFSLTPLAKANQGDFGFVVAVDQSPSTTGAPLNDEMRPWSSSCSRARKVSAWCSARR